MSWLRAFEHANDIWGDTPPQLEEGSLETPSDDNLLPIFGTLDDMPLFPDESASLTANNSWSKEEDDLLVSLAQLHRKNWTVIERHFPNKPPGTAQKRWETKHDPSTRRYQWTAEEDQVVLDLYRDRGACWKLMAERLPGRAAESIKNRFYRAIKKRLTSCEKEQLSRGINSKKSKGKNEHNQDHALKTAETNDLNKISMQRLEKFDEMDSDERRETINDLYEKMSAIEAFISKTKHDIKSLKDKKSNHN